jgi:hypothetical protein
LHYRLDPAVADQQNALGQAANDVLGEFLAGQKLLGQQRIFRVNERYLPV